MTDPQFFRVAYSGPGSIVSLTLDGAGADPTGLGKRPFGPSAGLVFDPRPFLAIPALGGPDLFEQGFPFTVGAGMSYRAVTSTGLVLTGVLRNRIGAGWTPVDGFGYINAQAAVSTG